MDEVLLVRQPYILKPLLNQGRGAKREATNIRWQSNLLQQREGSILSRTDLIQLDGVVVRVLGGGILEIECENAAIIRDVLAGRIKKAGLR